MNIGSKRHMVLIGFMLSLVSVTFNSVVISYVNQRLKAVDDERTKLSASLDRQAAAQSDGDGQFAIYRVMHNLGFAVPFGKSPDVQDDAIDQLTAALEKWYQAAYDVSQTEMTKADVDDFGQRLPLMEKDLQLARALQAATSPAEKARLTREHEDLQKQMPEPTSDLIRKIRELRKNAEDAEYSGSETALFSTLLPVVKSFQAETVASTEKKRSRVLQLQDERASLVRKADYASYGAITFQLLGLMFILTRDLLSHKKPSQ
jgi:lipopolysaccharide export LptBFGC system permease protein LptF